MTMKKSVTRKPAVQKPVTTKKAAQKPSSTKKAVAKPAAQKPVTTKKAVATSSAKAPSGAFDAAACWGRIERWFAEHRPEIELKLRPGAKEKEILAAEKQLGVRLPEDFRASLLVHDGQGDEPGVFLFPHSERLGSLKAMVACWKGDRPSYDKHDSEGRFGWLDDGRRVRQVHFHPKHVAFAGSSYWDYGRLLFDFVPGPEGARGGSSLAPTSTSPSCARPSAGCSNGPQRGSRTGRSSSSPSLTGRAASYVSDRGASP